ncbi:MAG: sensor domain-containing phosphodiesterase [Janthinobacterium lividum]
MTLKTEVDRLNALQELAILDTPPSESFDRISRMASQIFDLPIAAVSLTDCDRQWFKSRVGVEHWSIPREKAPCAQVAETRDVVVVEDLLQDPCYRESILASSGVRFYAGAPLVTREGFGLGALCVLGTEPRTVTEQELRALQDLSAMVMSQIELQHAFGRVDPISKLPNRTQFIDDLHDLARDPTKGQQQIVSLFDLIGVDRLRQAARVMGSVEIDELVKTAARNVELLIGPHRQAYHVGPTQFLTLAPGGMNLGSYIERVSNSGDAVHRLGGPSRIGGAVVGVAPFLLRETSPTDVLRIAQGAAQDARASGQFFHVHSDKTDTAFQRSFLLLRDFEKALQDPTDFKLVYQPRIELSSGRCVGAEALMRWTHPKLGPISPVEFIPLIERMSLARPTTAWVIEAAASQLHRWRQDGIDLTVSVNISSANLHEPDFADKVKEVLMRYDLPTSAIELEVTETAVMSDAEMALTHLQELADAGIRLAIDDFGTGYSSLSYLQRLPVQTVKIDRSFIKDLDTDPRQLSLVTLMISMARHLGHRVVAEGVETQEVLDLVRATSCDEVQGYFHARPLSPEDFLSWLEAHSGAERLAA